MSVLEQSECRNRLLAFVGNEEFNFLAPFLEPRLLRKGDVLAQQGELVDHVYFIESGLISVIVASPQGLEAEARIFGPEGCGPIPAILGSNRSAQRVIVQIGGAAYRIGRAHLVSAMDRYSSLRLLLLRFVQVQLVQGSFTALSYAVHSLEERLARWLLMCHDRSDADQMSLTHEFLSVMLAVRRPSVTMALHLLEGNGFIKAERGIITIRNRAALEEFARDAYGQPEAEYRTLIGPLTDDR